MSVKAIFKTAPSILAVLALWHTGARAETSTALSIADAYAAYGSSTLSRSAKRKLAGSEDLWRAVPAYFQLTLEPKRARVAHERAQLLSNPSFIRNASTRARPYLHFIVQRIAEREMPGELALLPIVESGYNPFARSHAGAQGPWQFIASTGDHYGLARNWWYDGRGDIIASTEAALDYLQHLADRFDGDWLLALAAYNCGERCVGNAQRKNRRAGKAPDYWSLPLPRETMRYVPKLLALSQLIRDAEHEKLPLESLANAPYLSRVSLSGQLDMALAAKMVGITPQALYQLNPGFKRWATPPGTQQLLIPAARAAGFRLQLAQLRPAQAYSTQSAVALANDNLARFARRHQTSAEALKALNPNLGTGELSGKVIHFPGSTLTPGSYVASSVEPKLTAAAVKAAPVRHNRKTATPPTVRASFKTRSQHQLEPGKRRLLYKVRSGDSMALIADKFALDIAQIKRWNNQLTKGSYLRPGQTLVLYVGKDKRV